MVELVDAEILEVVLAATGIRFVAQEMAKDTLRLPARLKGGGDRSMVGMRRTAFLGSILDVLPICIDKNGPNGEKTEGIYNDLLKEAIEKGAYDQGGTRNEGFLAANNVGPYPKAMMYAWSHGKLDATHNLGLNLLSTPEEWEKLGSLAMETPANAKNKGAAERIRVFGVEV